MTKEWVESLSDKALKSLIASTNPNGKYSDHVRWAKETLIKRGVDYSDCL